MSGFKIATTELIDELYENEPAPNYYSSIKGYHSGYRTCEMQCELQYEKLAKENKILKAAVNVLLESNVICANQLEGVSIAIESHGQNINVDFFVTTYKAMAIDARAVESSKEVKKAMEYLK